MLCAACLTTSVALDLPPPPDCDAYVPDELKADTPHAPPPKVDLGSIVGQPNALDLDITKNWINFGIAEAGQLEKSNADRRGERHIRQVCEQKYEEALARAAHRLKPWWKRIF